MLLELLVCFTIASAVTAAPAADDAQARIIQYENENDGTGNYHFSFETSNGLVRMETGTLVNPGQPDEHVEVFGNYKYFDEQGVQHVVHYSAGTDGYKVEPEYKQPVLVSQVVSSLPGAAVATLLG